MPRKKKEDFSYQKAINEIEDISKDISEGIEDIDILISKIETAKKLIDQCESALRSGETKIRKVFSDEQT